MSRAKRLMDELIQKKANGKVLHESAIKMKLVLKGLSPDKVAAEKIDNPDTISKLFAIAKDFNITLTH